jgi:hypothetical protein
LENYFKNTLVANCIITELWDGITLEDHALDKNKEFMDEYLSRMMIIKCHAIIIISNIYSKQY